MWIGIVVAVVGHREVQCRQSVFLRTSSGFRGVGARVTRERDAFSQTIPVVRSRTSCLRCRLSERGKGPLLLPLGCVAFLYLVRARNAAIRARPGESLRFRVGEVCHNCVCSVLGRRKGTSRLSIRSSATHLSASS